MFRGQGDVVDQSVSNFLIMLELFNICIKNIFSWLSSLVLLIKIRSFEMDAKYLCTFIPTFNYIDNIFQSIFQNFNALG